MDLISAILGEEGSKPGAMSKSKTQTSGGGEGLFGDLFKDEDAGKAVMASLLESNQDLSNQRRQRFARDQAPQNLPFDFSVLFQ
jgi:hypothetical protein